jgi:hypothetical protein
MVVDNFHHPILDSNKTGDSMATPGDDSNGKFSA